MTAVAPDPKPPLYDSEGGAAPPPPPAYSSAFSYGPAAGGYAPPAGGQWATTSTTTVITHQPAQGSMMHYTQVPATIVCQFCNATVSTATTYTVGTYTWLVCFILWLVGCGIGCCLIPFCMNDCKDVVHTCPNCKSAVGRYSKM